MRNSKISNYFRGIRGRPAGRYVPPRDPENSTGRESAHGVRDADRPLRGGVRTVAGAGPPQPAGGGRSLGRGPPGAALEADAAVEVVGRLLDRIRTRAVGAEVSRSVSPGHQVVKIVHESLIETLGGRAVPLVSGRPPPAVTLMVGLQGSGKTTSAAKLAYLHKRAGKRVLLVAADLVRPGAVEQLALLGERIAVPVFSDSRSSPVPLVRAALRRARREGFRQGGGGHGRPAPGRQGSDEGAGRDRQGGGPRRGASWYSTR